MKNSSLLFHDLLNKVSFENNAWKSFLALEFQKPYFLILKEKYATALENQKVIFPEYENIFRAFEACSFQNTKVVIIGQDPYFHYHQANGLAFSVFNEIKTPPSLKNIFLELFNEYGFKRERNDLSDWANQGVLLLNSILTVFNNEPLSCKDWGWQTLLENTIMYLNDKKERVVFLLWGNYAQQFIKYIDLQKHTVIKCAHPSPLSARNGFFHSNCFLKTNEDLLKNNLEPINWNSIKLKDDKI